MSLFSEIENEWKWRSLKNSKLFTSEESDKVIQVVNLLRNQII